jgi:hypothetical protein
MGRHTLVLVLGFLVCSLVMGPALPSKAQEVPQPNPLQLEQIPAMWSKTSCGPQTLGCYTFEQLKMLKQFDMDLTLKLFEMQSCKDDLQDMTKITTGMSTLLDLSNAREKDWHNLADTKCKDLQKVAGDLANCQSETTFWQALPWVVTGAVALACSTFLVGYLIGRR